MADDQYREQLKHCLEKWPGCIEGDFNPECCRFPKECSAPTWVLQSWPKRPKSAEKPLVDDLAEVLARTVVGWKEIIGQDLAEQPEVVRVLARYRAERK